MARTSQPLLYTASPYKLALADLVLWFRITFLVPPLQSIPSVVLPILPFRSGALDELYPTPANLYSIVLQFIFTVLQAIFLLSLPVSAFLGIGFPFLPPVIGAYVPVWLTWIIAFILVNGLLSNVFLNGVPREFVSQTPLSETDVDSHQDERWIFVNGVAAGSHWTQSNLDRLSLTFRREVFGIHNPTRGILFDLIECILERTFSYATPSTRMVYQHLLDTVSDSKYKKIVLILHSQGAIEGGLALDWLFATVPAPQLSRVEVYTFGSAANHFNNPIATTMNANGKRVDVELNDDDSFQQGRILKHIEHYANSDDYVARFGILNFRPLPPSLIRLPQFLSQMMRVYDPATGQEVENRYAGRLFIRYASGHVLNGNYLDYFFPMNESLTKVLDNNEFMNGLVDRELLDEDDIVMVEQNGEGKLGRTTETAAVEKTGLIVQTREKLKVGNVSRLWMYRNGMNPQD